MKSKALLLALLITAACSTAQTVNLSTYVRIGRYNLSSLTETSGITYNWDTQTLFVITDGGAGVMQVSKTGQLINSMTFASGGSPQGTEFYDTEGITYIGNGKFVFTEERDRQAVQFTYVAGSTLTRSAAKTVKLGTTVGNIGLEGLSYDPMTGGYIFVKEKTPESIFQTGIDFTAGTATNGSPSTTNSTDLFSPSLANLSDFSDVFALSNLPALNGQPNYGNLLMISQESAKVLNINRSGNISSSLTLVSDAGNPLSIVDQGNEGLTMDRDGILYVVNENGGGDASHPQLWVFQSSSVTPTDTIAPIAPTSLAASGTSSISTNLTWTVSTDNIAVSGYDVYKGATLIASVASNSYTAGGLTPSTAYTFSVKAKDAAGNVSSASNIVNVTTLAASSGQIRITEYMYSGTNGEFIEFTNVGNTSVDMTGWSQDDNNGVPGVHSLSAFGTVQPGESVILTETAVATFRTAWGLCANIKIIGPYTNDNLGRSDEINLYDASNTLIDRLTYNDQGSGNVKGPQASGASAWVKAAGLGTNNATQWTLSSSGDAEASFTSSGGDIGSPGKSTRATVSFNPCCSAPSTPTVTVINNCNNTSKLSTTATGTLSWNTGATTSSITVSTAGTFSVTRTVSGCVSLAGTGTASPKTTPSTPAVSVINNCNNTSTLSATATGTLLWNTGASTSSITVSTASTYSVTQTVNGCTSTSGTGAASPGSSLSAPSVTVTNNCNNTSVLSTTATGTLVWSTGATTSSITVSTAATYSVTRMVSGCTSSAGTGTASPKTTPAIPAVSVVNNCNNTSTLSTTSTGTLLWNTGATTSSISVSTATTYSVTQIVSGCMSAAGSGSAAPKSSPSAPVVTVTNNCYHTLLTADNIPGTLAWSTGETTSSITVTNSGAYTVVRTVNGCTGVTASVEAAPKTLPSDLDKNLVVNVDDFLMLVQSFNTSCTCPADLDKDGFVNVNDFLIILSHFNTTCQ